MTLHGFDISPREMQRHMNGWLHDRPAEELGMIYRVIHDIFMSPDSESAAMYYMGVIDTTQRLKHNCCACGIDHDAELLEKEKNRMEAGLPAIDLRFIPIRIQQAGTGIEIPLDLAPASGNVRCQSCHFIFDSLDDRIADGPSCPQCGWGPGA